MRRLRYSAQARADLDALSDYIVEQSGHTRTARDFIDRIRAKCASYARLTSPIGRARPEIGPEMRSVPFERYVVFLRYSESELDVPAVLHAARDAPAVFRERNPEGGA